MTDCIRPLARIAAVLLVSAVVFMTQSHAVPIRYTLVITPNPDPGNIVLAGTLGAVSFGGSNGPAILTFTFDGDTANVVSYFVTAPPNWVPPNASGYENLVGTASVKITDAGTGAVLGQANILPAAGIFVSADTTNAGIGFGSFAVANQSDPGFPGEPLYPFAMEVPGGALGTYNLQGNFSANGVGISCIGFPFLICGAPKAIPTSAGDLILYQTPNLCCPPSAVFTAQIQSLTFSAFNVKLEVSGTPPTNFEINGSFTLGTGSNGINPVSEPVTLQVGASSVTIPAGSFSKTRKGRYVYEGTIGGVALQVQIAAVSANSYEFKAEGSGANLSATSSPVTVGLTIGDDAGATSVSEFE